MTTLDADPVRPPAEPRAPWRRLRRLGSVESLVVLILLGIIFRDWLVGLADSAGVLALLTVFVSIVVAAFPFVVLGVAASAAISAFVPPDAVERMLPRRRAAAVAGAGLAGAVLPPGDGRAVEAAGALAGRGVAPPAAVAFLLAAPATNPIVLISTAVAFPDRPSMVVARFVASLAVALIMGWLWLRLGRPEWLRPAHPGAGSAERGWPGFFGSCRRQVIRAGGYLVAGALAAAALTVALSPRWLDAIAANAAFSVVALALLAVLLSLPATGNAFVAASLTQFSLTARLAFLVVGPIGDLRSFTAQVAMFGPRFAIRFGSAVLALAVAAAVVVGVVILP